MTGHGPAFSLIHEHRDALRRIAHEFGSAYVYDLDAMRRNAADIRDLFHPARIYFAIKANPLPEVIHALGDVLAGWELASEGELTYAWDLGLSNDRLLFGGPAKSPGAIGTAIKAGVRAIHLDSTEELAVARSHVRTTTRLVLRINTEDDIDAPFDAMVGGPSRFGVDEELALELARAGALDAVDGIHVYAGSQLRDWTVIAEHFRRTTSLSHVLAEQLGGVRYVNLGGGFGVPHAPDDGRLDTAALARVLRDSIPQAALSPDGEVALELGRYLTAPYGVLVSVVRTCKTSRGRTYALLDCGYNAFIRPSLTGEEHRIEPLDIEEATPAKLPTVVGGPLCTPTDTFGEVEGWNPRVGEAVAIANAGAYGWTMSPHFFLGHPSAAEVVLDRGSWKLVRRRVRAPAYLRMGRS